jgi:hypothetical protein
MRVGNLQLPPLISAGCGALDLSHGHQSQTPSSHAACHPLTLPLTSTKDMVSFLLTKVLKTFNYHSSFQNTTLQKLVLDEVSNPTLLGPLVELISNLVKKSNGIGFNISYIKLVREKKTSF